MLENGEGLLEEIEPNMLEMTMGEIIDEGTRLPMDFDFSNYEKLYINFSKVNFVNSCGIKLWVLFNEKLSEYPQLKVFYQNCSRMIVDQMNKTIGFKGKGVEVVSIVLPVFCNECEATFEDLQNIKDLDPDSERVFGRIHEVKCQKFPGCKKEWELDFSERDYLRFLNEE